MKIQQVVVLVAAAALLVGCESDDNAGLGDGGTNPNNVNNNGDDMSTPDDADNNNPVPDVGSDLGGGGDVGSPDQGGVDMAADMGPSTPWTMAAHDCVGNRTDTLWCDDTQTCFVGCGTTTTGNIGYFMTADGGATWSAPTTTPGGFFDTARVNSVWRDDAGTLFVSGEMPNSAAVVSVDAGGTVAEVFTRGTVVDNSFTVGNFRRAASGFAIAESLNGTGILHREADGGDPTDSWTSTRFWDDGDADDDAFGVQLLDMEVYNGEFWGVGSTIARPPVVMTPKWAAGDFDFGITQLATGLAAFDGEMWGLDVNADGVAVGGVNQDRDVAMIFTLPSGADATDGSAWRSFDVSTIFADATTWVTDVCRASNNVVYATGRESSQGWGFVLMSADGGENFTDITPYDDMGNSLFVDVSRCHAFDDGLIVAGAGGLFARYF